MGGGSASAEYAVTRPDTPASWSNYLGSTEYGAIITNNSEGYSFCKSGARGRFLRLSFNSAPLEQPGRYFYLRDRDSGDCWSALLRFAHELLARPCGLMLCSSSLL